MEALPSTLGIGALVRDRDAGEVKVGRDGQPVVKYALSDYDRGHLRRGVEGAAEILEAAGARRIYSSHARWVSYGPGANGGRDAFMSQADAAGWDAAQVTMGSFHIMGSARMGGDRRRVRVQPERRDVGRTQPRRLRRVLLPDRLGSQPDDLDRVDRPHERVAPRREAVTTPTRGP